MAQRTVVLFEDDLDGGEAAETVRFSLDGVEYEIDLSETNAVTLRAAFDPYVQAARRVGGRATATARIGRPPTGGAARTGPAQLAAIRDWARSRGFEVKARGRISRDIIDQYNARDTTPPPTEPEPTRGGPKKGSAQLFSG